MLSHSVSLGNNSPEFRFIDDLINLCKRHNISYGDPQDLVHLGADLLFNDDFRSDLFPLCAAISHMAETELTPEQLLALVARAFAGPSIPISEALADIPHAASIAFINGYKTWLGREAGADANMTRRADRNQASASPQPRPTLYYTATSRAGADLPQMQPEPQPAQADASQRSPIPPNTPIDSLTLSDIKKYLEEIEGRVSRIEPKLDQMAPKPYFTPEYFERLEALDAQRRQAKAIAAARNPDPLLTPQVITPVAHYELLQPSQPITPIIEASSALAATAYSPVIVPYQTSVVKRLPSFTEAAHLAAEPVRLHRLRATNVILASLLVAISGSVAIFAYRYLNPTPASFADTINRFPRPLGEVSSDTSPATDATPAAQPLVATPDASSTPATDPDVITVTPARTHGNHLLNTPQPAVQIASKPIPPVARPHEVPPSFSGQSVTFTAAPESQSNLPAPVTPSIAHPDRSPANLEPSTSRTTTHLVANTPPSSTPNPPVAPPPAPLGRPAPANRLPQPTNLIVTVPAATIMNYAISTPEPLYLGSRHLGTNNTVEVETTISREGRVTAVRAINGALDVRAAAIEAVQAWRFKPLHFNGDPPAVVTTFKFIFKGQ